MRVEGFQCRISDYVPPVAAGRKAGTNKSPESTSSYKDRNERIVVKIPSKQAGYLMEIPLIMALVGVALTILVPVLPGVPGKIAMVAGGLVWIVGSFYLLVIPGWLPGDSHRMNRNLRIAGWLAIALTITVVVVSLLVQS